MEAKLESLPEKIAMLKDELASLRQRYEGDPTNWQLGTEVGLKEQAFRWHADRAKREAEMEAARERDRVATARRQAYRPPTSREFEALVPRLCPNCQQPTRNQVQQVGEVFWYHRTQDCERVQQKIEWS